LFQIKVEGERRSMPTLGFWNINSGHTLTDVRGLARLASDFAKEHSLEILFLIECGIPYEILIAAFKDGPGYYPIDCANRFKVITKFDPDFMKRLQAPAQSDRFDLWHLSLPLQEDVIVGLVHGLDKRNNSVGKQELFMQQVAAALTYFERDIGHDRSILLGDFNSNPFESPVASAATGLHAVSSRAIAESLPRRMFDIAYPYFYNPMWNLYGDEPPGSAPATYYYRGSDPYELYWHMLDQVLIRPSLLKAFDFSTLKIVTTLGDTKLTTMNGYPNVNRFSDHLPVVFGLDLLAKNGGAENVEKSLA
jgi:hypothetical protein